MQSGSRVMFLTFLMFLGAALMLPAKAAFAAHPLVTDDAGTEGRGNFLLELTVEYAYDDEAGSEETGAEAAVSFAAGLTDSLDVVLGLPYGYSRTEEGGAVTSEEDGVSDLSVELKWRFYEGDGLGLALKPGVTLPTGDDEKGLGNGRPSYSIALIASKETGHWAFHVNLGYARNEFALASEEAANRQDIWHASVAAEAGVSDRLTVVGNIGIETNPDRASATHPAFVLGGVIYSVTESMNIDLGIKAGLNSPETDIAALAGMSLSL